jgi:D-aminoacyl-tRNA deacylase
MRIVLQRVKSASVTTVENHEMVAQIGHGVVALVGIHVDDTILDVQYCCQHILNCKLWENDVTNKPWKYSVKQKQYDCLIVSQFTLYGTIQKKSSYIPDYKLAMKSISAQILYNEFIQMISIQYGDPSKIHCGRFGTMMDVALINDGPVTLVIDSRTTTTANFTTTTTAITNNNNNDNDESVDNINSTTMIKTNNETTTG